MITKNGGERDLVRDTDCGKFEDNGLGVGRSFSVYLVAGQDYQIRFFAFEDSGNVGQGTGIGGALVATRRGHSVAADAGASREVEVGNLEDLEFAVFVDMEGWWIDGDRGTASDREEGALILASRIWEKERRLREFPSRAGLNSVGTEQNIYGCDGGVVIRLAVFGSSFEPNAARSSFPAFVALMFFERCGVEVRDANVKNHVVFVGQFGLALALDVDEGVVDPTAGKIEIFVNAVPFLGIELAAGKDV